MLQIIREQGGSKIQAEANQPLQPRIRASSSHIEKRLQQAVMEIIPDADAASVLVRHSGPKFGDYQSMH